MKEKDFEKKVKQFLKEKGCWVLKTWSNGVQRQGIPDLLVCCNGFFVGVELKAEKDALATCNYGTLKRSGKPAGSQSCCIQISLNSLRT